MKKFAVAALFAFATAAANAAPITVTYTETVNSGLNLHGSFSGTDANKDGLLTLGELNAWTISYDHGNLEFLNAFGTFDYKNNVWSHDGFTWDGATRDAFMTWNDWKYSATAGNGWQFATTIESAGGDVPEPASLALMGISLAALGVARRKKQG